MATKKTTPQIVFAEFPDWSKLTKAKQNSLYEQMCQLWKDSEWDKATQLFDYLFENGYDKEKLDEFAEMAGGDFQYHYARKLTDVLENGDFAEARKWLKKAAENGSYEAQTQTEDGNRLDGNIISEASDRLKEINEQIMESFYRQHKNNPMDIFLGEESAVLNENGHIEFVHKKLCLWNFINGAEGLILAKDEPVERSKFKMTGFSPELKKVMKALSKDTDEHNCYPNIIDYSAERFVNDDYIYDDFQTECETWKILMQLLDHGYSLVEKQEYTTLNSDMLPKAVHDEIEGWRKRALRSLMNDHDNHNDDDDNNDDDDDLDLDDLDFDKLLDDLDFDDEDDKPAKKSKKSKKK